MKVYGIPNCNTVKKAIDWLNKNEQDFEFHDYKKKGINREKLEAWANEIGWENLINKKGTTWKTLPSDRQLQITNADAALALMIEKPSLIRRPVIEAGKKIIIGYDEEQYEKGIKKK